VAGRASGDLLRGEQGTPQLLLLPVLAPTQDAMDDALAEGAAPAVGAKSPTGTASQQPQVQVRGSRTQRVRDPARCTRLAGRTQPAQARLWADQLRTASYAQAANAFTTLLSAGKKKAPASPAAKPPSAKKAKQGEAQPAAGTSAGPSGHQQPASSPVPAAEAGSSKPAPTAAAAAAAEPAAAADASKPAAASKAAGAGSSKAGSKAGASKVGGSKPGSGKAAAAKPKAPSQHEELEAVRRAAAAEAGRSGSPASEEEGGWTPAPADGAVCSCRRGPGVMSGRWRACTAGTQLSHLTHPTCTRPHADDGEEIEESESGDGADEAPNALGLLMKGAKAKAKKTKGTVRASGGGGRCYWLLPN
jgi:hypothetical protein